MFYKDENYNNMGVFTVWGIDEDDKEELLGIFSSEHKALNFMGKIGDGDYTDIVYRREWVDEKV